MAPGADLEDAVDTVPSVGAGLDGRRVGRRAEQGQPGRHVEVTGRGGVLATPP